MRVSLVVVIGTLVVASPARADHTSVHATATGEVASTDNLFAAGSDGDRQADVFFTVRPGLLYAYDAPRMIHDFTGEAEVTEYLLHGDQPSLSGRGGWRAMILPGPRSELQLSINAGTGVLTSLSARSSADQSTATVAPAGKITVQQADASEHLSWISSEHTRVSQGVLGRYGTTDDGAGNTSDTREVGGNLSFERSFRSDTISLDAAVSYLRFAGSATTGMLLGDRLDQQLSPKGTVAWRHDFDRQWSANADGGIVFLYPVGTSKNNPQGQARSGTFSVYGAQVAYNEAWGRASLSARRTVSPNLYLAQNTLDDQASVQVVMPLPWLDDTRRNPKLAAVGSLGVTRTQLINSDTSATEGTFDVAHLDASVAWTPKPNETFGLRYELVYQSAGNTGLMPIPSYYRNTLYFTFSLRYPDRVAGEVPKRTRSMRSDRDDLATPGAEPVVPDVLEQREDADRDRE